MENSLSAFIEQVRWLHEIDYGDFKRKVGLYIERLQKALPPESQKSVSDLIQLMRQDVIYASEGDIEHARRRTLQLAHEIEARLQHRH
jgi:hypothetical protein